MRVEQERLAGGPYTLLRRKGGRGTGPCGQSLMTATRTPVMAIKVVIIHLK